ncbi:MAG: acyltransferase family protein [Prevotella sp.]
MNIELLSRAECNVLRGLAIIGIFLHNYCHWLGPVVKENEYQFFQRHAAAFAQAMSSPDQLWPMHIVSFFGHYGVPIFLFLSAYGLERKYNNPLPGTFSQSSPPVGIRFFIWKHYVKLFRMMIVGFISFIIIDALTPGSWHYNVTQIVAQLGMFNNLLPNPDHNIWPGPYWFFGLMMQLYIVYRLLLYRRHWGWTVGLMAVCLGIQFFLGPESEALNRYRYNFMGGMLPFGMGLLFARYGERIILVRLGTAATWMSLFVTSALIVSMSYSFWWWNIIPSLVCVASVYFAKSLKTLTSSTIGATLWKIFEWFGGISGALFVIHPVLRKVFIPISRRGDYYTGLLLYVIASVGAAYLIHKMSPYITSKKESPRHIN